MKKNSAIILFVFFYGKMALASGQAWAQCLRFPIELQPNHHKCYSLEDRMRHYGVSAVSISVIENDQLVSHLASGTSESTLFQAGSVSKALTALGALKLVKDGKIGLDQDISPLLKSPSFAGLTIRQLLSHSAGINVPGFPGYSPEAPLPSLSQILKGTPPANSPEIKVIDSPGLHWKYSGGGTTVIQWLIETITGKPFASWMSEYVLKPLEMNRSQFTLQPGHQPFLPAKHFYPEFAAAGLWTNSQELAHSLEISKLKSLIGPKLFEEMLKTQKSPSGLGPMVRSLGKTRIFEHEGVNLGFVSRWHGWRNGARSGGIAILTAGQGGEFLIPEIIAGAATQWKWPHLKSRSTKTIKIHPSAFQLWPGRYKKLGEENYIEIKAHHGGLWLQFNPSVPELPLYFRSKKTIFTTTGVEISHHGPSLSFQQIGPHPSSKWVMSPHVSSQTTSSADKKKEGGK